MKKFTDQEFSVKKVKPKISSLYKEGFLNQLSSNKTKKRWCVLKITQTSAKLYYYRARGVC